MSLKRWDLFFVLDVGLITASLGFRWAGLFIETLHRRQHSDGDAGIVLSSLYDLRAAEERLKTFSFRLLLFMEK